MTRRLIPMIVALGCVASLVVSCMEGTFVLPADQRPSIRRPKALTVSSSAPQRLEQPGTSATTSPPPLAPTPTPSGTPLVSTPAPTPTPGPQVATLAGKYQGWSDGAGVEARFSGPNGVDVDGNGFIFVADAANHAIRKVSPSGIVSTVAGTAKGYRDGNKRVAQFNSPFGVVATADGSLYVADTMNHCIRNIAPDGTVTTVAGDGNPGYKDEVATAAQFNSPFSLDLDSEGNLYIADTGNHRIRKLEPSGKVTTLCGSRLGYQNGELTEAQFAAPSDLTVVGTKIYLADYSNHCIRLIDLSRGMVSTLAGNGFQGEIDGAGEAARFNSPTGLAADAEGNIIVADNQNHRIRSVTSAGQVSTVSGSDAGYLNSRLSKARFNKPTDVAVSGTGEIYVIDTGNNALRVIER